MKRTLLLPLSIFLPLFFLAQKTTDLNYKQIKPAVEKRISEFSKEDKNMAYLLKVKVNFEKSPKINMAEFKKDNVGVSFNLEESDVTVSPAKFNNDDDLVKIIKYGSTGADAEDFTTKYINSLEKVGSTKLFREMMFSSEKGSATYAQNPDEYVIEDNGNLYFVRGTEDWMFVTSISKSYQTKPDFDLSFYAFRISMSGDEIFGNNSMQKMEDRRIAQNTENRKEADIYPLFHDVRTDKIRKGLRSLIRDEPFSTDKTLQKYIENLKEPITRKNITFVMKELTYFTTLKIPTSTAKVSPFKYDDDILNIRHLSSHALADAYLGMKMYDLAIENYKKSVFDFPYDVTSGTTAGKDVDRIVYDISKAAYKAGRKNEAYAYLLGLLLGSENYQTTVEKDLKTYLEEQKEDRKAFKTDLDKSLKTIIKGKEYTTEFTFRNTKAFFLAMSQQSAAVYEREFKNSDFYISLK